MKFVETVVLFIGRNTKGARVQLLGLYRTLRMVCNKDNYDSSLVCRRALVADSFGILCATVSTAEGRDLSNGPKLPVAPLPVCG